MALDAARRILRQQGYAGLTTRAVAREMGYTVGTLYHLFHNLDHLISEVNAQTVREMRQLMRQKIDAADSPGARLRAIAHTYLDYAFAHPNLWRLAVEHPMGDVEDYRAPVLDQTRAVFAEAAQLLGELTGLDDQEKLQRSAAALWSAVHGACHLALTGKLAQAAPEPAYHIVDQTIDTFVAGLRQAQQPADQ